MRLPAGNFTEAFSHRKSTCSRPCKWISWQFWEVGRCHVYLWISWKLTCNFVFLNRMTISFSSVLPLFLSLCVFVSVYVLACVSVSFLTCSCLRVCMNSWETEFRTHIWSMMFDINSPQRGQQHQHYIIHRWHYNVCFLSSLLTSKMYHSSGKS